MLAPVRTAAPAALPVTLAEAKAHARVDHDDENAVITAMLSAAVERLDGWSGILGRALVTQTWRQDYEGFADVLRLPLFPCASVASVTYLDAAGTTQTASASLYDLRSDERGPFVKLKRNAVWPATGDHDYPVSVTAVYGQAAADVPAPIKSAILLMTGDLYENRETATTGRASAVPMSVTVDRLLAPYRRTNTG